MLLFTYLIFPHFYCYWSPQDSTISSVLQSNPPLCLQHFSNFCDHSTFHHDSQLVPEVNIKTLLAGGLRPHGIPLVGPHRASLGLPSLSLGVTILTLDPFVSYSTCFFHLLFNQTFSMWHCTKISTLLSLETAAIFPSPFSVYRCPSSHRREQLSTRGGDKGKASPDKISSQVPLTSGSCLLPSTLTKPILPVLHEKLHVAAALTKWEVQCVIILHLFFPRNPEPKPSKHQRVVPAQYQMTPPPSKVLLTAESQIPIKKKKNLT